MTSVPSTPATTVTDDLQTLQQTVAEAPPAAVENAQTVGKLLGEWAARNASNGVKTAALLPLGLHAEHWKELQAMNQAVLQRLQQQQTAWLKGCARLVHDAAQIKHANTLSKLVSQQLNVVGQFGQLLNAQASALMLLQENVEIDYGYWASQKLN